MYPKPVQKPHPPILIGGYVDRVLKRAAVDGDGWLTYFYRPESFAKSWDKIRDFAKEAGKDPDKLLNASQLPIYVGKSRQAVESQMMEWLTKEWDFAVLERMRRKDSAIMGTVDECVEQLKAHLAVGTQKIIFVPYKYEMEQIETHCARDHSPAEGEMTHSQPAIMEPPAAALTWLESVHRPHRVAANFGCPRVRSTTYHSPERGQPDAKGRARLDDFHKIAPLPHK